MFGERINMSTVMAVSGPSSVGKTSTIRLVYELLLEKFPDAQVRRLGGGKDIGVIVTIGDFKIGIESQGDPTSKFPSRMDKHLELFVKEKCDVIVCATRTEGATVWRLNDLRDDGYEIVEIKCQRERDSSRWDETNATTAREIVAAIEELMG
jgi:hypothetical protein